MRRAAAGRVLARWADRIGFLAVVVGVVGLGFVQGSTVVRLPLQLLLGLGTVVVLNATVACVTFAGTLLLSGATMVPALAGLHAPETLPESGPTVAAVVPVYGDATVLDRSVGSLLAAEYRDLRVCLVCEPGDEAAIERAREFAADDRVDAFVNESAPGSKAGAVDAAVAATAADYVGVFDADERVDPRFVPAAVAKLADHELVQGRTLPRPEGFIESVAYYESILLGYVAYRLLALLTGFRMAASNAVLMRRSAFDRVGGYDPSMLTEDFDFAFRCYVADVDVAEALSYPSEIEAAHTVADWWGQRKRWMTGYAQVFHRRVAAVRPTAPRTLLSVAICGGAILGNAFLLSLVSQAAVLAVAGGLEVVTGLLVAVWGVALGFRVIDVRAGRVEGVGLAWLLVPVTLPLYSLAALKGVVEYPTTWEGEWYRVAKGGGGTVDDRPSRTEEEPPP